MEKVYFSKQCWMHLNPFAKHEPKSQSYTSHKNQLKMNYKSNVKVIKLLEENLHDRGLSKVFSQKQDP